MISSGRTACCQGYHLAVFGRITHYIAVATELQQGESAKLAASIVPKSIAGPFAKALFIQSNAPAGPKTITLRGNLVLLITVKPLPMIL
ncbi:hypothetical protein [Victivallis sp. Marseille-Q1083]|uniref:hypothetical protein n=1 Tax=Victivallis sp. Marseille-Q1083 TaxID=2717288 RepID=UPI00158AAA9D|nr:hypothetical protein [Victivallis sp. Marseille-Q1083]